MNSSQWTCLFPNQNTGSFLMLGPNLLNSCIIETDYLHFPTRQFATYSFRSDAGLAQGVVNESHDSPPLQEGWAASTPAPFYDLICGECRRLSRAGRKEESCSLAYACAREEMMSSGMDCPKKESFSSESLTKARVRAPNPSKNQETAKTFKLQIRLSAVARTELTLALDRLPD